MPSPAFQQNRAKGQSDMREFTNEDWNPYVDVLSRQYNWAGLAEEVENSSEHEYPAGVIVKEAPLDRFQNLIPQGPQSDSVQRWQALEQVAKQHGLYVSSSESDPESIVVGKVVNQEPKVT